MGRERTGGEGKGKEGKGRKVKGERGEGRGEREGGRKRMESPYLTQISGSAPVVTSEHAMCEMLFTLVDNSIAVQAIR